MLALILMAAAVAAAPPPGSRLETAWRACVDAHTTNFDWARCGGAYVQGADAELNTAWAKLMTKATGQTRGDLVKEERAWIAYKAAACTFYGNGDWGREGEVLDDPACRAGVIETRTRELDAYSAFLSPK